MRKKNSIILWFIATAVLLSACTRLQQNSENLYVSLGQEFTLHANQSAVIKSENFEVKVTEFIYSPCPKDAQCFWSGLGVGLEYKYNGEVMEGMNLAQAFGYQTEIVDSDYKTYAKLKITKIDPGQ